jgi:hypothetical protein
VIRLTADLDQKEREGESPVVEWWPGLPAAAGNRSKVAPDFGTFLLEQVRRAIAQSAGGSMVVRSRTEAAAIWKSG